MNTNRRNAGAAGFDDNPGTSPPVTPAATRCGDINPCNMRARGKSNGRIKKYGGWTREPASITAAEINFCRYFYIALQLTTCFGTNYFTFFGADTAGIAFAGFALLGAVTVGFVFVGPAGGGLLGGQPTTNATTDANIKPATIILPIAYSFSQEGLLSKSEGRETVTGLSFGIPHDQTTTAQKNI
jgi:hypothetical protein